MLTIVNGQGATKILFFKVIQVIIERFLQTKTLLFPTKENPVMIGYFGYNFLISI